MISHEEPGNKTNPKNKKGVGGINTKHLKTSSPIYATQILDSYFSSKGDKYLTVKSCGLKIRYKARDRITAIHIQPKTNLTLCLYEKIVILTIPFF